MSDSPAPLVLLTGATGYVGGRLLAELQATGTALRCLARRPEYLKPRLGAATEIVAGDILDEASVRAALAGVHTAYYLVHSMASATDYAGADRRAAELFGRAALDAGVQRLVYLGGLAHGPRLSSHLASRLEVGAILRRSGVPTLELQASIIIGSGSLSFEMVRALVEKLPVMTTPRWVRTPAQPIAIEDVVAYLVEAARVPQDANAVFEIGGADVVTYLDLMREYARQRGLRRLIVPVPVLTPGLSSLWLGLVTPLYARVGRQLIEGVRHPTVVQDRAALDVFAVRPRGVAAAVARALAFEDREFAATRWSDALCAAGATRGWGGARFGARLVDSRRQRTACAPEHAFAAVRRIGGRTGWYAAGALWRVRGWLDLLAGGVGMRRGRRDPEQLVAGDTVDCWRVESVEPGRLLRLAAEMRLPGRAWLQFEVLPQPDGGAEVRQTALFDPLGLSGLAYWYGLWPLHQIVFAGMLRGLCRNAEAAAGGAEPAGRSSGGASTGGRRRRP
jgi:uncharacterized protein YbjT (DUF2867 family)